MNRLGRLSSFVRVARSISCSQTSNASSCILTSQAPQQLPSSFVGGLLSTRGFAAETQIATDYEQATGLERAEVEGKAKGIDIFHEDWLDAPWGTEDNPVQVTSIFAERIVGVPDPYDDSIVWWGKVKEGDPPKQLVESGEFFVLKRIEDADGGHH